MSTRVAFDPESAGTLPGVVIRIAHADEYDAIGALTLAAYDDIVEPDDPYARELADARHRATRTDLLVAVDEAGGELLGSVAFVLPGSDYCEVAREDEAEFRMLAVAPAARGRGIGERLVRECLERARRRHCTGVAISTVWNMRAAHRLYARLGFRRAPERDWWPEPGVELMCYIRELTPDAPEHADAARPADR